MKPLSTSKLLQLGGIALLLGACSRAGTSSIDAAVTSSELFGALPELVFTDTHGNETSPAQLKGSVWVLSTVSTSIFRANRDFMQRVASLQEILDGTDTRIVSLSVDPLGDTPEELAVLSKSAGANPDFWFFWVGSEPNTAMLLHSAYRSALVGVTNEEMNDFMNASFESRVVAIDREGQVRGTYDLLSEDGPELLVGKLRALAKE